MAHYGRAPQVALDAAQRLVTEAEERRPGIASCSFRRIMFKQYNNTIDTLRIKHAANNAYKLYSKTRAMASSASIKRAKVCVLMF